MASAIAELDWRCFAGYGVSLRAAKAEPTGATGTRSWQSADVPGGADLLRYLTEDAAKHDDCAASISSIRLAGQRVWAHAPRWIDCAILERQHLPALAPGCPDGKPAALAARLHSLGADLAGQRFSDHWAIRSQAVHPQLQ